jgi:hypothetical protein
MAASTASPVAELREQIAAKGIALADAILMVPRPVWLGALIGRNLMRVAP